MSYIKALDKPSLGHPEFIIKCFYAELPMEHVYSTIPLVCVRIKRHVSGPQRIHSLK